MKSNKGVSITKAKTTTTSLQKSDWNSLYIGGEWIQRGSRRAIQDRNPYDNEVITDVPSATNEDVDRAFEIAESAQRRHLQRTPQDLAQPVQEAISCIEDNAQEISRLLAIESGSSAIFARFHIHQVALPMMREAASFPFRAFGQGMNGVNPGRENLVKRVPTGIVSVISPWNLPLHLSMRAVAPALVLGNAVILKPSSNTPICGGLLIARIFEQTSLPKGLLSVLPGDGGMIGDRMASHPKTRVIAFTGSTEAGIQAAGGAASSLARPAMELGEDNVHIVLEDADLDRAIDGGIFGSFIHQGQICMRINRHLVHRSLYEEYVSRLTARVKSLKWGDPREEDTIIGPVINEWQRGRILGFIRKSVEQGAKITMGGRAHGNIIEPTVLRDARNEHAASCRGVFGPVAPIISFDADEEAVRLANGTPHGLSGSVHSRDLPRACCVASQVETGMIHVNDQSINDGPHVPFGGMKESGMGRYNGEAVIAEMTELRWISG